ncbi:hypothetical protein BH10BAC3_BH10BAC3_34120 [soil metagenome]
MKKIIFSIFLQAVVLVVYSNTYFISATGNDANSGLTIADAWQTIDKVNSFSFSPGDAILFQGGATFSGWINNNSLSNGTIANRITLSSYGSGKAVINSGIQQGISLTNSGNITINSLIFQGIGYKVSDLYASGIDIFIDALAGNNCDNIIIDNVETFGYGAWGILVSTNSPNYGFNHLSITNSLLHDNGTGGLQVVGYYDSLSLGYKLTNTDVYIGYTKAYNNYGRSDLTYEWSGSGILIGGTTGGLIEYCEAYANGKENGSGYAGPVGIFLGDSKYVTIQNCKSHHNLGGPGKRDGGGFDLDQGSSHCVIQNCESYENEGAGYGLYQAATANSWEYDTIRNNISTNDGRNYGIYGAITFWGVTGSYKVTKAQVYGNQVNMTKTGYGLIFLNNNLTDVQVHDNVFCLEPPASYLNYGAVTPIPSNATVLNSTFPCTVQFCPIVAPGVISGLTNVCNYVDGPAVTYSIDPVASATDYNWTVPAGSAITSSLPFTTSITVTFSSAFTSGNVAVKAIASCGTSAYKTLAVGKGNPATPGTISGPANVCSYLGGPAVTYTIAPVNYASGYNWTVPAGATLTSVQPFTTSITVAYTNAFVSGNVAVQSLGPCGGSAFKTLAINKGIPATPGSITGPTNVCANIDGPAVTYSIAAVTNATGYNWTVPEGATITSSPPFSPSITVTFSSPFVSGNVAAQALGNCGNSALKTLIVNKGIPATPGTISGLTNVCANIGGPAVTYSITAVTNATGYNWTVPGGATITSSPPFSTSITVTFSSPFVSGNVAVQALGNCGNSAFKTLAVNKGIPAAPGTITGPTNLCANIGGPAVTYSITAVTNATGYNWTVPTCAAITSSQPFTTAITVTFSNPFVSGNVAVQALGNCGNSAFKTLAVNKGIPATPGTISGLINLCANIGGPAVTYSITAVTNATGYNWTVPAGATITSSLPFTTAITVTFSNAFVSGNVAVQALGTCGYSAFKTLAVNKGIPATAGTISGPSFVCSYVDGTSVNYSIAAVTNATGYNWTVPTGATITSAQPYTTSITVIYRSAFISGNIAVQGFSTCGNSAFRTLAVTKLAATPATLTGPISSCKYVGIPVTYATTAVTNASSYTWTVPAWGTINGSATGTSISVTYPSAVAGTVTVKANTACGSSAAKSLSISTVATPISISGATAVCASQNQTYTVYDTANAVSAIYTWVPPTGISIVSGQGTKTLTVLIGSTFTSGNLGVKATTCGITGSTRYLLLTKAASCPTISFKQLVPLEEVKTSMFVYPNPGNGNFVLHFKSENKVGPLTVEILSVSGKVMSQRTIANFNGSIQLNMHETKLSNGFYIVRCSSGKIIETCKLIIQR